MVQLTNRLLSLQLAQPSLSLSLSLARDESRKDLGTLYTTLCVIPLISIALGYSVSGWKCSWRTFSTIIPLSVQLHISTEADICFFSLYSSRLPLRRFLFLPLYTCTSGMADNHVSMKVELTPLIFKEMHQCSRFIGSEENS